MFTLVSYLVIHESLFRRVPSNPVMPVKLSLMYMTNIKFSTDIFYKTVKFFGREDPSLTGRTPRGQENLSFLESTLVWKLYV